MTTRFCIARWLPSLALAFVAASAPGVDIQLPPEIDSFKQDTGAELANAHCLVCHSVEYVSTQPRLSRTFWKGSIQKMREKYGATIPEEQVPGLLEYLVKNYGLPDSTNSVPATASPGASASTTPATVSSAPVALDGPAIAAKYWCVACHHVSNKIIGPPFHEVAMKYQGDARAGEQVKEQIHKGGSGKWGPVLMPPFPQVTEAETRILSEWILSLK